MMGLTEAVRRIVAANTPILCLDTSSLLDLTRDPMRGKFGRQHAEAVLHFVARAERKPASVKIILAEQVLQELDDHLVRVSNEAEITIDRLNAALEVCDAYGILPGITHPLIAANSFSAAAAAIIQRIRRSAIHLRGSVASTKLAFDRVSYARAPAATGKQSMKDCVIIEIIFNWFEQLGRRGSVRRLYF